MNKRTLLLLLPLICYSASAAQAQTLPTLTYTLTGSGTGNLSGVAVDYRDYTFDITGFSNVGPDPNDAYTIDSFGNSTIENSAGFYKAFFSLPNNWSVDDSNDFIISTPLGKGIHATDPSFDMLIFQIAGTPAIDVNGAPFTLYHQPDGVDPFLDSNGSPVIINAVPEASSLISFGLLLLGGLTWKAFRRTRGTAIATA